MKIMNPVPIILMVLSLSANAEVFKCKNASGKIIYQSEPCASGAILQDVIKVKEMTPEETEAAKEKLKTWQEEQAANDAAKLEAEKERQAELERQESLELQRRSVMAQEQQAIAAQQRQNQGGGVLISPYGLNRRYWGNNPYPPDGSWDPNLMRHHPHHNQWEQPMSPQHPHHDRWDPPAPPPQTIRPSPRPLPGAPAPHPNKPGFGLLEHHQ